MLWIVLSILVVVVIGFACLSLNRKRRLSSGDRKRVQKMWASVEATDDPVKQILEADKVLDQALGMLGYQGSLGDKLKVAGPRFSDLNGVWSAHKLRNRIAHEVGVSIGEKEAARALNVLKKALGDLGL